MYLDHWQMQQRPFDCNHAPRMFVPVESAMVALTKIRYALSTSLSAISVTGPAGTGKTELIRMSLEELNHSGWKTVYVPNTNLPPERLVSLLGSFLGANTKLPPLDRLLIRLQTMLEKGVRVCLAFDEMHTVGNAETWELIRMLMNVEAHGRQALNIIIAGQSDLEQVLDVTPSVATRLTLRIRLAAFSSEETQQYILYRLKVAGCTRGLFTRQAADSIFSYSRGLPARINRICDLALLTGFGAGVEKIGPELVHEAAIELGFEQPPAAQRTATAASNPASATSVPSTAEEDILASVGFSAAATTTNPPASDPTALGDCSDDILAGL